MLLIFVSFFSFQCHRQKWCIFFTPIKLVAHVLVSACAIAHIKWRRLGLCIYENTPEKLPHLHPKSCQNFSYQFKEGRSWSIVVT